MRETSARREIRFSLRRLMVALFYVAVGLSAWRWLGSIPAGSGSAVTVIPVFVAIPVSAFAALGILLGHGRAGGDCWAYFGTRIGRTFLGGIVRRKCLGPQASPLPREDEFRTALNAPEAEIRHDWPGRSGLLCTRLLLGHYWHL